MGEAPSDQRCVPASVFQTVDQAVVAFLIPLFVIWEI